VEAWQVDGFSHDGVSFHWLSNVHADFLYHAPSRESGLAF